MVLRRNSVLMVERGRPPFQGLWSFPGGRAESGEEAEATARRELLEETGLGVGALVRLGAFQPAPDVSPLLLTVFAARGESGDPRPGGLRPGDPRPGDDASRAEFVPFHAVLARRRTAGSAGWIARALLALSDPPLL